MRQWTSMNVCHAEMETVVGITVSWVRPVHLYVMTVVNQSIFLVICIFRIVNMNAHIVNTLTSINILVTDSLNY